MTLNLREETGFSTDDSEEPGSHPPVLVVVTLFRPTDSVSSRLRRLSTVLGIDGEARRESQVYVLLFDNSPLCDRSLATPSAQIRYEHHPENGGTRAALLRAVELAVDMGIHWILALDQDSILPINYLRTAFTQAKFGPSTAAIVPDVLHNGKRVSPCRVTAVGRILPCRSLHGDIDTAILSGAILSVAGLRALGQPPDVFWLDFLDHWIFRSFRRHKREILAIPVQVGHDLSVSSPNQIPPWRMQNILRSERAFVASEEGLISRWAYRARLAFRLSKQVSLRSPVWRMTWNALRHGA